MIIYHHHAHHYHHFQRHDTWWHTHLLYPRPGWRAIARGSSRPPSTKTALMQKYLNLGFNFHQKRKQTSPNEILSNTSRKSTCSSQWSHRLRSHLSRCLSSRGASAPRCSFDIVIIIRVVVVIVISIGIKSKVKVIQQCFFCLLVPLVEIRFQLT